MRFVLVVGTTKTAAIDGISAAGEDSELRAHTPAADAEIVEFGRTVRARRLPVSPTGCPTPAVVTRAVRELLEFDLLVVDAGLEVPTDAPTKSVNAKPGGDIRDPTPVPTAEAAFTAARTLGRTLSDQALVVGESIPGGTTTASGVLRALGEPFGVSSSLPENPTALKRDVVAQGLAASGLDEGDAAADPVRAVRLMGDPVLAATMGLAVGAVEAGSVVTLAGGTQMVAAGALIRHAGCDGPLELATTSYVAADDAVDLETAADALDLDLVVTDPGFDQSDHQGLARYGCGEAKEGVGMGGALALADRDNVSMSDVRERSKRVNDAAVEADGP